MAKLSVDYDKLTNKVLGDLEYSDEDIFFVTNINNFYNLFNLCLIKYGNLLLKEKPMGPLTYMSKSDTYLLVSDFFKSISDDYYDEFNRFISNGNIIINNVFNENVFLPGDGSGNDKILIDEKDNLKDSLSLVHEFFHYLNYNHSDDEDIQYTWNVYTEMMSILGEFKFLEYLEDNGYSKIDINIIKDYRKSIFIDNMGWFIVEKDVSDIIRKDGLIDSNNNIHPRINLKTLSDNPNNVLNSYTYSYGTCMASYLHDIDISNEDIINLNNGIKSLNINDFHKMMPNVSNGVLSNSIYNEFCIDKENNKLFVKKSFNG